jgi:hypothetical protein
MVCASHQLPVYIQTGATGALAQTHIPSAFAPLRIFDWRKLAQTGALSAVAHHTAQPHQAKPKDRKGWILPLRNSVISGFRSADFLFLHFRRR